VLQDRVTVLRRQRHAAAGAEADAAGGAGARLHQQVVRSHTRDRALDGGGRALADLHHRDHRGDADDDANGGEHRAHGVAAQCAEGGGERAMELHEGTWIEAWDDVPCTISPSWMRITRWA